MFRIEVSESLTSDAKEVVENTLAAFNAEHNSVFWTARESPANAPRPLNVVARSADGVPIGGLLGVTQFAWFKISLMSVMAAMRRAGVGTELLKAAEIEAVRRGCQYAYVDTMDYQAPAFYERHGYQVVGRLENWDSHGHAKLFFTKRLAVTPML